MYISRVRFMIKPAERAVFQAVAQTVVEAARQMSGCTFFSLLAATDTSDSFILYEEWDSAEQAEAFKQTPLRNDAIVQLTPLMIAAPKIVEYTAHPINVV